MNPKVHKFLEDNQNMTLVGFAWALLWRIYLVILAAAIGLVLVSDIMK